ncbi:hypothetical protein Rt10032_c02g0859 [Rhodotorula toruloides]|uniref:Uncharacterized protein n=1 Tax=Rhodotorula toruloides TaxID=5286 RepID=A0A511K924_RHOTO|nr:hypothetical protein Rt10032_c02g0859 [Rhodotorula toruloides]
MLAAYRCLSGALLLGVAVVSPVLGSSIVKAAAAAFPPKPPSFLDPVVVSHPLGVNATRWEVAYSNGSEPYPGAHLILGNPAFNGTNETLAWPGQPAGGMLDPNADYAVKSNFDFQSLNLALNQELIELDLFHNILVRFSTEEFEDAGLDAGDRTLIQHMADQEVGHAIAITNMLDVDRAAKQCIYKYPFNTVKEAILFSQIRTRWGEAGVYGFLNQLDSRPSA